MKGLWLVARREILVRGRSKSYLLGLAASAVLVVVLAALPGLLGGDDSYTVAVTGTDAKVLSTALPEAGESADLKIKVTQVDDEAAAKQLIEDDEADLAIVDDERMITDGDPKPELAAVLNGVHQSLVSQRQLTDAGFDVAAVNDALNVAPLDQQQLNGDDSGARQGIAYILVIVLFFMVMMPTMYVAVGVVEEKSSRIVEILLSSLKTWQLLGGKVLGLGILGFVNFAVPVGVGLAAGTATGALSELPPGLSNTIASALVWWVLGFGFFAGMAGALASMISRQEDMNSAIGPMTMLLVGSYVVASIYVWDPTSAVARVLSFIPPFSMFLMPVRDAVNDAPLWQQGLSAAALAVGVVGMFAIGAYIYRRSVMRTGSKVKLSEIWRKAA